MSQTLLKCVKCHKKLTPTFIIDNENEILKCECFSYPRVSGIYYLKRDKLAKIAVTKLKNKDLRGAFKIILNSRRYFLILYLVNFSNTVNKLVRFFGFRSFISLLQILSYDTGWSLYLKERERSKCFDISKKLIENLRDGTKFIDIGCGTGHVFPLIYKKTAEKNVVGVDISFINLLLSKVFFAQSRTVLICSDVEKGIPIVSNYFDVVHLNATFFHMSDKRNEYISYVKHKRNCNR